MGLVVGGAQPRLLSTSVGQMLGPVRLTGGKASSGARPRSAPCCGLRQHLPGHSSPAPKALSAALCPGPTAAPSVVAACTD